MASGQPAAQPAAATASFHDRPRPTRHRRTRGTETASLDDEEREEEPGELPLGSRSGELVGSSSGERGRRILSPRVSRMQLLSDSPLGPHFDVRTSSVTSSPLTPLYPRLNVGEFISADVAPLLPRKGVRNPPEFSSLNAPFRPLSCITRRCSSLSPLRTIELEVLPFL